MVQVLKVECYVNFLRILRWVNGKKNPNGIFSYFHIANIVEEEQQGKERAE